MLLTICSARPTLAEVTLADLSLKRYVVVHNPQLIPAFNSRESMRALHILLPMGGEGSRFLQQGIAIPKPLIRFHGEPLFQRALNSVHDVPSPRKVSAIVRQDHVESHGIADALRAVVPNIQIFTVPMTTRGAVETCLQARPAIAREDGILVLDCDLEFRSTAFVAAVVERLKQPAVVAEGGVLASFCATNPRYSYAEADATGRVRRTAEKEVISAHALAGAYFFSTGQRFLEVADASLRDHKPAGKEAYVSLLFNRLLSAGEHVQLTEIDEYHSYGTPEELAREEARRWTLP